MGLFDNLKNKVNEAAKKVTQAIGNKPENVVFPKLPVLSKNSSLCRRQS